eukprot:SAG11_NODE_5287_length_1605_cov_7.204515_1_plen_74_part_00
MLHALLCGAPCCVVAWRLKFELGAQKQERGESIEMTEEQKAKIAAEFVAKQQAAAKAKGGSKKKGSGLKKGFL